MLKILRNKKVIHHSVAKELINKNEINYILMNLIAKNYQQLLLIKRIKLITKNEINYILMNLVTQIINSCCSSQIRNTINGFWQTEVTTMIVY